MSFSFQPFIHHIGEEVGFFAANISKTLQLTSKQSRWINGATGKKKNMYVWFWGEMSQYDTGNKYKVDVSPFISPFFLAQNCSGLRTCSQCLQQPECGWCGDPSSTGKGLCIEGSYRGPMKRPAKQGQQGQAHVQSQDLSLDPGSCPREKGYEWAFIHCPGKGSTSCPAN